jgi:thiamine pyrophosphate-dependent acetolactate synthase large subunit-like protein
MQIEITTKTWLGNAVLWNRKYKQKTKGTTNKGRKLNPERIIKWLQEVLDRR